MAATDPLAWFPPRLKTRRRGDRGAGAIPCQARNDRLCGLGETRAAPPQLFPDAPAVSATFGRTRRAPSRDTQPGRTPPPRLRQDLLARSQITLKPQRVQQFEVLAVHGVAITLEFWAPASRGARLDGRREPL